MTDDVFEDLVNLYLDKEISPAQLSILKAELGRNTDRKRTFESYCRMHQASHIAALSACPVIPRLGDGDFSKNKRPLFALDRQVWAAAVLIAVIGSFATIYMNGPFGAARIANPTSVNKWQQIETFAESTSVKTTEPPLEFFRALKTQNQSQEWAYIQELRHSRATVEYPNKTQPSLLSWNGIPEEETAKTDDNTEFELEFSSYEFRR